MAVILCYILRERERERKSNVEIFSHISILGTDRGSDPIDGVSPTEDSGNRIATVRTDPGRPRPRRTLDESGQFGKREGKKRKHFLVTFGNEIKKTESGFGKHGVI